MHLVIDIGGGPVVSLVERRRRADARAADLVELADVVSMGEEPNGYGVLLRDPEGNELCTG